MLTFFRIKINSDNNRRTILNFSDVIIKKIMMKREYLYYTSQILNPKTKAVFKTTNA